MEHNQPFNRPVNQKFLYNVVTPSGRPLCIKCMSKTCDHFAPAEPRLSPKCLTIIRLVGGGLSNKEIGIAANIATGTVKVYMSNKIFPALRVESRLQVALWAKENAKLLQEEEQEELAS